jgi:hypothetical protein
LKEKVGLRAGWGQGQSGKHGQGGMSEGKKL